MEGVFDAKIIVFMARFLILSIKFSFHSISGFMHLDVLVILSDKDHI